MRKTWLGMVVVCCVFAALPAVAQAGRKPGLYEVTSKMTWQQSPFPAGMQGMPNMAAAMNAPHTAQVCVTREMIDKYGGPLPQSRNNECHASNVKMTATGMTADWVCSGSMNGTGTVESSWTDENHTASKVHFMGTMTMGPNGSKPVEWISESTSVYKGADCGSVKPMGDSK